MTAPLYAEGVTYSAPGRPAPILREISVAAPYGRVMGLLGPNGSGKSTLLHVLAGLLRPESGTVHIHGRELSSFSTRERSRVLAVMEQASDTDTDLTAHDVVALGRLPHTGRFSGERPEDRAACAAALAAVDMAGAAGRRWRTLSGGERQRVQAARALAQEPSILLLDEPTNHLDIRHQHQFLSLLNRLAADGLTVVVVLHDLALAAQYCDHAIVLHNGSVHTAGYTASVLTPAVLRDVFGVTANITSAHGRLSIDVTGVAQG